MPTAPTTLLRRVALVAPLLALTALPASGAAQSLRGSQASVDETYDFALRRRLTFHRTSRTVRRAASQGAFVKLTSSANVRVKGVSFPYVLPTTRTFVQRLGAEYRAVCGEPLTVTSAVRPSTRQPRNAVEKSVHPTGLAIDLRKPSGDCRDWLRDRLLELEADGLVDATEEFNPPHFHVVVYSAAMQARAEATSTSSSSSQLR